MADLTTTLSESVVLNGAVRGTTNTVTITNINNVYERIVTCTAGQATYLAAFDTKDNEAGPMALPKDPNIGR